MWWPIKRNRVCSDKRCLDSQYWKSEYEGYSSAEKAAEDCGCKGVNVFLTPLTLLTVFATRQLRLFLNKMRDNLCRIETALMGVKPEEGMRRARAMTRRIISTKLLPERIGGVSVTLDNTTEKTSGGLRARHVARGIS